MLSFRWWKYMQYCRVLIMNIYNFSSQYNEMSYRIVACYSHDFKYSSNFPSTKIYHRCSIRNTHTCAHAGMCSHTLNTNSTHCAPLHHYLWPPSFIIHSHTKLQVINERSIWWHAANSHGWEKKKKQTKRNSYWKIEWHRHTHYV